MTPDQFRDARATLAEMDGQDQPYSMIEMARILRLQGAKPAEAIRDYERGKTRVSGPLTLALDALLSGWRPADYAPFGAEEK